MRKISKKSKKKIMESASALVSLKVAPKSKNYESYEKEDDPEFTPFKKSFESSLNSVEDLSLQGNSYSKVFCEQFSKYLKTAEKLQVHNVFLIKSLFI